MGRGPSPCVTYGPEQMCNPCVGMGGGDWGTQPTPIKLGRA